MSSRANRATFANSGFLKRPIAHRGLHNNADVPENSLGAFQAAIDHGLPIELDVRLLSDGQVIVLHDSNLRRMTGMNVPVGKLATHQARAFFLLNTQERLPLLEEVLHLVNGQVPLLIELKNYKPSVGKLEGKVVALLNNYSGEFAVQSFNTLSLIWLHRHMPHIWRGQLSAGWMGVPLRELTHPDFVAFHLPLLTNRILSSGRDNHIPVLAWTIQNSVDMEKAQQYADNFIFDSNEEIIQSLRL